MSQDDFIMLGAAIAQVGSEAAASHANDGTPRDRASILGAILLLAIYRMVARRRA